MAYEPTLNPQPVSIKNTDSSDNSLTAGGVYGQKVHIVGDSDKYVRGNVAEGAAVSDPVYTGFRDGSGNLYGMRGDSSNGLDVDVTRLPALVAGTALIGKVGIDQTTPGTTNRVDIGAVIPGTAATNLGKAEDAQHTSGDVGVMMLGVRNEDGTDFSGTDKDYVPIATDAKGHVFVRVGDEVLDTHLTPRTSGGFLTSHIVSAASTNATNIKASAGQVFGWYIYNSNAAARKVAFHNTAGTPTAGSSIFFSVMIPAGSAANVFSDIGITFGTGIAVTMVTGLADSDSTGVAANDLICNIFYK
jgi:hypothetical protein